MSRKYKQKGYQDEERPERGHHPRRERQEGPRGRGLGAPRATVFRCRRCGREIDLSAPEALAAGCPSCGADLHTCTHCAHFDSGAPLECRQEIPQRIAKKAANNDCELFEVKWTQEFAKETESRSDAAKAFDDLFDI